MRGRLSAPAAGRSSRWDRAPLKLIREKTKKGYVERGLRRRLSLPRRPLGLL